MALPIIKAIQNTYPQAHCTLLVQPQYVDLLTALGVEGELLPLPKKNWRYFLTFLRWRGQFDAQILFTNSERGDIEAWLIAAKQRFGITRPDKPRKLLTHHYALTSDFAADPRHQTHLWRDFTAQFHWHDGIDLSPYCPTEPPPPAAAGAIGLICGSANTPEKRWPVGHWQALIGALLQRSDARILLLGTADDRAVCEAITDAIKDSRVENLAGRTTLAELTTLMRGLSLLIGNDTGGLHLANAVGVPVIGLYGYTNPARCRPIYDAPLTILPATAAARAETTSMADISVAQVLDALDAHLT